MHTQVCTRYTLVQQELIGLIRTLFKVFCLRDIEQKNDMGGSLSARVGFKLAVLIYTFGNEFQKFPGFQSLHEQRVRSTQISMLSQECPLMQWFFGAGCTWEGLRTGGQEEGRVSLQKPIHVRPTFGDRTFKPSYNSCNCNCSRMGDPRPTAGTPPGGWSVSVVTGPSHLGDLSRHVSWVYKTYFT